MIGFYSLFLSFFLYQGIRGRVYETFMVLLMLSILVFGLVWVFSALLDDTDSSRETLQSKYKTHFILGVEEG